MYVRRINPEIDQTYSEFYPETSIHFNLLKNAVI